MSSGLASYFDADAPAGQLAERADLRARVDELLDALESGAVRAAEPGPAPADAWTVNTWVKRGILAAFRLGVLTPMPNLGGQSAFDKDTLPLRRLALADGIRLVPGGTSIRRGCHVARGVTLMPPAYVNVGAYVAAQTLIDSHALVGSCAQIGANVHLSAAAQIGGVLEPVGARPVVVEDGAFIGALAGLFEGVRVSSGALVAAGVVLTRSTPIADLVGGRWIAAGADGVLTVPPNAVVVPGARRARGEFAAAHAVSLQTPVLIKYRDPDEDPILLLEEALRA
jgi:2,3,4,5-tetrahydropyridine-2-carboxylate N-succinyltransferase